MNTHRIARCFALSLSLAGCAGSIQLSAHAAATPTHAEARATARVDVDPRAALVAGIVGGTIIAARRGADERSHPAASTDDRGEAGSQLETVAIEGTVTLASGDGDVRVDVTGGSLVLRVPGGSAGLRIEGGAVMVIPHERGAWTVSSGSVRLSDGTTRTVSGGSVVLARDAGGAWVVAQGEIDAGTSMRQGTRTAGNVDAVAVGSTGGGVTSVDTRGGNGPIGDGAHAAGSREATVATGDARAADTPEGGAVIAGGEVSLGARVLASLDVLMTSAPAGSRDALRAAAAVQTVIVDARTAQPALYDVPVVGSPVVVLLDVSYSMSEPDPHGVAQALDPRALPTKLDVARAETVKLLAELPANTTIDLVAYSTAVHPLWQAPRVMDEASLDEAIRWLATLRPEDETHPLPAVQLATEMHPGQLVLVGDGRPTDRDESNAGLLAAADGMRSAGGRMDVVGLGEDQDTEFLDQLALRGGGVAEHR